MNIDQLNKKLFNTLMSLTHWLTETKRRNIIGKALNASFRQHNAAR